MKAIIKYISLRDINILKIINNSWKCKFLDIIMPAMTYLGSFSFMFVFCTVVFLLKATQANGVKECKELLSKAQNGNVNANFIEGMGCV
ncbi:MAG: hypothetical protein MUO60_07030, partial [Clostridiaceae bacterium]|nr:hypothetical protein [Clostridiaceae bacterium]